MYIKIIGSLFLMGSAALIGFLKAEELNERVKKLQELKRMMMLLLGELRFHHSMLSEAFRNAGERTEEPFRSFLVETAEKLEMRDVKSFSLIWEQMTRKLLCTGGFKKEDGHLLELLGSSLGYLDLTMQTETLNLAMLQTEEAIRMAKELQKSRGRLYQTMGITAGAFLTLLII